MNLRAVALSRRVALILMMAVGLGACRAPDSTVSGSITVDPRLEAYWRAAGGLATFGPPIAAPNTDGNGLRQTFLAVEIIADEDGVRLAPLGVELGLAEPPVGPIPGRQDAYSEKTGHTVYAGFAALYSRLGGEQVVGAPISEASFREGQIVQIFENAGMYRPEGGSPDEARLMALGLTARPPADSFGLDPESLVLRGRVRSRPFGRFLQGLGGEALFGQPLTEPYLAQDGALEQVYERAVVFSPDGTGRRAALRPLGAMQGPADDAAPRSGEPGSLFFKETGHNVQWAFADFYRERNGKELLGQPLEEAELREQVLSQRFENGILVYRFDLPVHLAVQLAPLGSTYLADHPVPTAPAPPTQPAEAPTDEPEADGATLAVEATLLHPIVPSGQEQELRVAVLGADRQPVRGAVVRVWLIGMSGEREVRFPASDPSGETGWRWTDDSVTPGEIVAVMIEARIDGAVGTRRLTYAHGFPPAP